MAVDLQITDLSDTGYDPTPAGGAVIYSVTIENSASDVVTNAVTIFDLPAGTTASVLPPFCSADAGTPTRVVCNIGTLTGTLAPGGNPVTFQIQVDTAGQSPGTVTMRGAIGFGSAVPAATTPIASLLPSDPFFSGDTNTGNNIRNQATTLTTAGDLRLSKTATPDPVVGGAQVTYTLTVTNDGPSASSNFNVVDTLPAATALVAGSFSGAGWTFNAGTMTATHAGTLAVGASASFSFRAKVNAGSGNIVNAAVVTAAGTPDPNPNNDSAQVTTAVTPGADLTLSKSAAPAPAIAGQPVTFTLVARNFGPSDAQNVSFTDVMPAGFVITGGTQPAGWNCVNNAGNTDRTCSLTGAFANGAVANFTIVADIPSTGPNSSGDVTNTATITSTTPDPNSPVLGTDNNNGSVTFTVLADGADLSLSKTKTPALVATWDGIGPDDDSRMTSQITVRNLGPRVATGQVQVVDELAPGEEFLSASGPWNCVVDTPYAAPPARQRVTCDLAAAALPLAVNANAPLLSLVTRARAAGTLTNTACTGGSNGTLEPLTGAGIDVDPATGNDCNGVGTRTTSERADLSIAKQTNGPGPGDNILTASGNSLTYTLTVTNHGPDSTTGIVVNDAIPGYVAGRTTITANAPAGWVCSTTGGSVICRSGTTALANGASAAIVLTVNRALFDSAGLGAGTCGGVPTNNAFCNTAGVGVDGAVAGSVGEVDTSNNSASDWVQIDRVANVQTTAKNITSSATGQAGVNTTYVMSFRNQGPSTVPGVVFRDVFTLPADDTGFVLISASRTGGGSTACTATPGAGITTAPAAGGTSYANPTLGPAQVTITCAGLSLANDQTEGLTVVIRPNVNVGNTGRVFNNIADFYFDRDGDGNADPSSGTDGNGSFDFNTDATPGDDSRSATLPFGSGSVDLITNKVDTGFAGGIDPLGYDATNIPGNAITYRVTVRNNGPSVATNVRIADTITPLPGRNVRFIGDSANPGGPFALSACTVTAGSNPTPGAPMTLDCLMPGVGFGSNIDGVVASGQTSTLYLRYQYETAPGASGDTLSNSATASSVETDTNLANNDADQETTIRARADLGVAKTTVLTAPDSDPNAALPATTGSVTLRQPFFYVIDGINNGTGASLSRDRTGSNPLNGTGTVITDNLPAGLVVTGPITWRKDGPNPGGGEVPTGTGTCTQAGNTVTCNLGDLTVTGKVRVIVPARWDNFPAGGTSNNTATIATEQVDPNPGNNTVTVPLAVTRSSIAGFVFEDRDRAGANGGTRQSAAAEPGIAGVTVTLTGTDAYGNAVNRSTVTAADGSYLFNNLSPSDAGNYTLLQTQPAAYVNGPVDPPTSGGQEPSLGGNYSAGAPDSSYAAIAVGGNVAGVRYNFPEVRRPTLSGFVYIDGNFNNVRDAGSDAAIAGATIELLDALTGAPLASTSTDGNGFYQFANLDPLRAYTLREVLPAGSYQNRPTAINPGLIGGAACVGGCTPGTGVAAPGGPDAASTDRISLIDLGAGLDGVNFNFGEDAIAAISGTVYVDRNRNGDFDGGDAGSTNSQPNGGLQGVTVTLTGAGADGVFGNGDDPAPVVLSTDATGAYQFTDLIVGQNYRITETQPTGYADGNENPSGVVTITTLAATGSAGNDFGEVLGSIAGSVYEDFSANAADNNNGAFDAGENPIANATLTLTGIDVLGNAVNANAQTDGSGGYVFQDLLPPQAGTFYTLTETQPVGYIDGKHTPGNAATPGNATTANVIDGIAIAAGQQATGYLFGELANTIIQGTVYLDRDNDGSQGPGEPGIPGVAITIEGAGPDGLFGTADDLPPVSITSNANGDYSYGGAITGLNYRIVQTQPTGLASGQENNGNQITVTNLPLTGSANNDFGEIAATIAGNVYLDANNNGVREAGENGIAGVAVNLPAGTLNALGQPVAAAVTDSNGDYLFIDLLAGSYTVTEQLAQPVVGAITTINGISSAGQVGGTPTGVATPVSVTPSAIAGIALPAGLASVQNNFGETLPVSIEGTVFFDIDNNGAQTGAGETGIAGVLVTLTGSDDSGASVSLSTRTDANGKFSFAGLRPGTYRLTEPQQPAGTSNGQTIAGRINGVSSGTATPIAVVPSAIAAIDLTTPDSHSIENLFGEIPLNSSISGRVWLDLDNDGVFDDTEAGIAGVTIHLQGSDLVGNGITLDTVTLADGSYLFADLPPGNYTLSEPVQPTGTLNGITVAGTGGGTVTPVTVTPSVIANLTLAIKQNATNNDFGEVRAAAIAGRVYSDNDNDGVIDPDETGIGGVEIVLDGIDDLGKAVSLTLMTDSEGRYRFDGLRPGTYRVTEPVQPEHTLNGITSPGHVDGRPVGSASPVSSTPSTITGIVLSAGEVSIDNNFGEIGDSADVVVSKSATPTRFTVNTPGLYTLTVRNIGHQPTQGEIVVQDRLPAGITLAQTPAGNGWTCSGNTGESRLRCTSNAVVASGATHPERITVPVRVSAEAAAHTPANNAVMVEGGGEKDFRAPTPQERSDFEGDPGALPVCDPAITQNACRLPTPVQLSASLSGTVWFDRGSDTGLLDGGDSRVPRWIVEVLDTATGQIVGSAVTGADGTYLVPNLVPGVSLTVRFRDPVSGVLWARPVSGETAAGPPAPCATEAAIGNGSASSCASSEGGSTHLTVVLAPGQNLPEQSLPLNPGGVVYDAITRDPVPGSQVTLSPVGACPGYSPATGILNAGGGGYRIDGDSISMTVGAEGFYQFLLAPTAPASCRFRITVTPPAGYRFQSEMIPVEAAPLLPPATPGIGHRVQPNANAPTGQVGPATIYFLELQLGSGLAAVVNNHIPLDPQVAPGLVISKTGDRRTVEVGDTMSYSITLRQTAGGALGTVNVIDRLPPGMTYVRGTARVDGAGIADPLGQPGPTLVFDVGPLPVGAQKVLSYRVRVGVGSQQGDGINRARAHGCSITGGCVDPTTLRPYPGGVIDSNAAEYRVQVSGGVFADEGCVLGKVFVDCNFNHVQDHEELGIPGVRMYFEDGTWLISDSEGKYSYCGLPPKSHTLKVDASTLPVGARLTTSSNRNLGDAGSLFIDLKNGELHRADFIEGSCSNPVIEQVKARRTQGEVRAPETEPGHKRLRFESKPPQAPVQGTDSAKQSPIVDPRPTGADSAGANPEAQP